MKMSVGKKAELFDQVVTMLQLGPEAQERLPEVVAELVRRGQPDVVVAFAFAPSSGEIRAVSLPEGLEPTPQTYGGLSSVTMSLAQMFQSASQEMLQRVDQQKEMGSPGEPHRDGQPGDGGSAKVDGDVGSAGGQPGTGPAPDGSGAVE